MFSYSHGTKVGDIWQHESQKKIQILQKTEFLGKYNEVFLLIYLYEIFLVCKCQFIKQNVRDVLTSSYKGCVYMFTFGSICKCNTFIFLCIYTHIYKKSIFYYNTLNFGSDKHSSSFYQVKILKLRESVCKQSAEEVKFSSTLLGFFDLVQVLN